MKTIEDIFNTSKEIALTDAGKAEGKAAILQHMSEPARDDGGSGDLVWYDTYHMEEKKSQSLIKKTLAFFDHLEDKVRTKLSHKPILYTFIGGFAIVLFWRGVWMTADMFPFLTGPVSILISVVILLVSGLFVSFFVGDRIILSGLKGEKKLIERTELEVRDEAQVLTEIQSDLKKIELALAEVKDNQETAQVMESVEKQQ